MGLVQYSARQQQIAAREYRTTNAKRIIKTGINYWDDATGGIWAKDLVVLTARSGAGKTEISRIIAQNVSRQDKTVHVFALEAYKGELYNRTLFTELSKLIKHKYPHDYLNYRDFCLSKYDSKYIGLMSTAEDNTNAILENITTFYRDSEVLVKEVTDVVGEYYSIEHNRSMLDLIIIDHLHYFDFDDDKEYINIKKAVKQLRTLALTQNVAILLIAHIRKTDKKTAELVPDMEEIGGASEIFKEATQVVSLAPYSDMSDKGRYATLMRICKNRVDSRPLGYLGLLFFDSSVNQYEPDFLLCKAKGKTLEILDDDKIPSWANRKNRQEIRYENYTDI